MKKEEGILICPLLLFLPGEYPHKFIGEVLENQVLRSLVTFSSRYFPGFGMHYEQIV